MSLGSDLHAAAPFYGAAAPSDKVSSIRAALLVHLADDDQRINDMWPGYEAALKANNVRYEMHRYPGTRHGFHNNSTPRHDEPAAKLAWDRTIAFFNQHLG